MKGRLPAGISFDIDTQKILSDAMKNIPADTIGILAKSMEAASTTGGLASLLNLNLSGNLQAQFKEEMKAYETSLSVMKNLRVMEVLTAIIDGFNEQLSEQNEQALSDVATKIRPNYYAPFQRIEASRQWYLKVVSSRVFTQGTSHRTLIFSDYRDYDTDRVKLQSLKGLDGTIDFNNPATFMNLDADELDVYVSLEREHLSTEIDRVFGESGEFSSHVTTQYKVLDKMFEEGDTQYKAGQALVSKGFYRVAAWKGGPDVFTVNRVVGSIALSCIPYYGWAAALAFNAACIAVDMADKTLDVRHGFVQIGVGIVSAVANAYTGGTAGTALQQAVNGAIQVGTTALASGIKYNPDGSIGYDFNQVGQSLKGQIVQLALSSVLKNGAIGTAVSAAISSGLDTGGNFWEFGFDTKHITEHLATGLAAGLSRLATNGLNSLNNSSVSNNAYLNKSLGGGISNALLMGMSAITGGAGFKKDYSTFDWNKMYMSPGDIGQQMGERLGYALNREKMDRQKQEMDNAEITNAKLEELMASNRAAKGMETSSTGSIMDGIKSFGQNLVTGALGTLFDARDAITSAWSGVKDFGSRIKSFAKYGHYECANDLGMNDNEYSEWIKQREYYESQGIDVKYTTETIDTTYTSDEETMQRALEYQENDRYVSPINYNSDEELSRLAIEQGGYKGNAQEISKYKLKERILKGENDIKGGFNISKSEGGRTIFQPSGDMNGKTVYLLYCQNEENTHDRAYITEPYIEFDSYGIPSYREAENKVVTSEERLNAQAYWVKDPMQEIAKYLAREGYTVIFDESVTRKDMNEALYDNASSSKVWFDGHGYQNKDFNKQYIRLSATGDSGKFYLNDINRNKIQPSLKEVYIGACWAGFNSYELSKQFPSNVKLKAFDNLLYPSRVYTDLMRSLGQSR